MKYKINDYILVKVEYQHLGNKRILIKDPLLNSKLIEQEFPIVYIDEVLQNYTIHIDDDIIGWIFDKWHVIHWKISDKLIGKKFYDINESILLNK